MNIKYTKSLAKIFSRVFQCNEIHDFESINTKLIYEEINCHKKLIAI